VALSGVKEQRRAKRPSFYLLLGAFGPAIHCIFTRTKHPRALFIHILHFAKHFTDCNSISLPLFSATAFSKAQWAGHDRRPGRLPRVAHHRGLVGIPLAPAGPVAMRGHGHFGQKRGLAPEAIWEEGGGIERGGAPARPLVLSRVCTPPARGHGAGAAEKRGTDLSARGGEEVPVLPTRSSSSQREGCCSPPRQDNRDGLPTTITPSSPVRQSRNAANAYHTSSWSALCHSLPPPQAFYTGWTQISRHRAGPLAAV